MNQHDRVYVVYSKVANTLPIPVYQEFQKRFLHPSFIQSVIDGKNALDFVIASEVGRKCVEFPDVKHIIISNDAGYDSTVMYLRKLGYDVERAPTDTGAPLTTLEKKIMQCLDAGQGGSHPDKRVRLHALCQQMCGSQSATALYTRLEKYAEG